MVRVWNVPFCILGGKRLCGMHMEIHVLYNTEYRRQQGVDSGYVNHPQAKVFRGKLGMLITLHDSVVDEMCSRGYNHKSPLPYSWTVKSMPYTYTWDMFSEDLMVLKDREGLLNERDSLGDG